MLDLDALADLDAALAAGAHVVPGLIPDLSQAEHALPDQVRDVAALCPHMARMAAE